MTQEALERTVMDHLLAGGHPVLSILRAQYAAAEVAKREFTGAGWFVYWRVPPEVPRAGLRASAVVDDVAFTLEGSEHGGSALLFLADGALDLLELVMWAEDWPAEPRLTGVHYLTHVPTGDGEGSWLEPATERDGSHLARQLSPAPPGRLPSGDERAFPIADAREHGTPYTAGPPSPRRRTL